MAATATPSHGSRDKVLKIILVGSSGVGKTSLLQRYTDGGFKEDFTPTIGVDFEIKTVQAHGHRVTLQIWDTAGQEKFKATMSSFYRNVDGVIVVYDITNMNTFIDIESWFVEVQHHNTNSIFGLLVGNKRDIMFRRVVDPQLAADLANRLGVSYIETSAKDCTNVCELFGAVVDSLVQSTIRAGQESPAAALVAAEKVNVRPRKQQKTCSQRSCCLL